MEIVETQYRFPTRHRHRTREEERISDDFRISIRHNWYNDCNGRNGNSRVHHRYTRKPNSSCRPNSAVCGNWLVQ
jgi:hypothetical protein